jgi:uncharacterized membrane protein
MYPFILSTVILLILDGFFLTLVASPIFKMQIADVQSSPLKLNILGVILSYVFLIFGLHYFIISKRRPVLDAFLFGLTVYGVYETTSLAVLKKWRIQTVLMDTLWGGVLFASTTFLTYRISSSQLLNWIKKY